MTTALKNREKYAHDYASAQPTMTNKKPMKTSSKAINAEVDGIVLARIHELPATSAAISVRLNRVMGERLPKVGRRDYNYYRNCQEHANRSCQRLRKEGLISFDGRFWTLLNGNKEAS